MFRLPRVHTASCKTTPSYGIAVSHISTSRRWINILPRCERAYQTMEPPKRAVYNVAKPEKFRWDFGIRKLIPEWKLAAQRETFTKDLIAGITVPTVSVPVSLAAALLSNVPVHWGLLSAIVGAVVGATFGGTRFMIVGPAAGMALVVSGIVSSLGLKGLILASLTAGLFQLGSGVFGLASVVKCIPLPVLWGFTSGIGCLILSRQIKPALELMQTPYQIFVTSPDIAAGVNSICTAVLASNPYAFALTATSLLLCMLVPRILPKFPITLATVAAFTAWQFISPLPVATVGALPANIFQWDPTLYSGMTDLVHSHWKELLSSSLLLYYVSSIQALLSAAASDKIARNSSHNANQEMIGQGVANVACAGMGSMPTTGLIVQTTLNVVAGAASRRAAVIHALTLAAGVSIFGQYMQLIPIPALTGVLMYVALKMIQLRDGQRLYRTSKPAVLPYTATFVAMLVAGLGQGVLVGTAVALATYATQRILTSMPFQWPSFELRTVHEGAILSLKGDLFFLASMVLDEAKSVLEASLSKVRSIDVSAAEQLETMITQLRQSGWHVTAQGASPTVAQLLQDVRLF